LSRESHAFPIPTASSRWAGDLWISQVIEYLLAGMPDDHRAGLLALLEALAGQDFLARSQRFRDRILHDVSLTAPSTHAAVAALRGLTLFLFYGPTDESGQNPNWSTLGYPGPIAAPPAGERPLIPYAPDGDVTLEADVCVVGSGAGGGVMADVLAEGGLSVVVLEAGVYFAEPDFDQLEIAAYRNLYWRGGPTPTDDLNVSLLAGSCLGGGTVINWRTAITAQPRPRALPCTTVGRV
jgi:hypothetical protein